jgi:hypothetical protein
MAENIPNKGAAPGPMADSTYGPATDGPRAPAPQVNVEDGPPRVVIPHTARLPPEVKQLGESSGAEFFDVSDSDTANFRLFDRLWSEDKGFSNIEQDVLPTAAMQAEVLACQQELCAGYYWQGGHPIMPGETEPRPGGADRVTGTLACVKFSAGLMARLPNAVKDAAARTNGRKHFNMLDLALIGLDGVRAQFGAHTSRQVAV